VNQPRATLAAGMQVTPSVRLLSPLGAGGMGAVWLADHTALNTRVVVKFMLGGGIDSSAGARTRFKREAEAASQVKSPHVVQTFDYGVTAEGVPFIVMEHLEGRDLGAEIAARGALDPVMVIAIVTQVAKALSKAHTAGLLHRDIKPDNIFLCQSEGEDDLFVKLLDFGIAKAPVPEGEVELDGQTKTGQVVGTPFYMSPEQVTAQKVIDLRSDLWSLGIVAFEAFTGKRPFDGPSFGALAVKIATGEPPRPSDENPDLPKTIDAWFSRACAREPSARFGSARELADALRTAFEGVVSLPPMASGAMSDSGPRAGVSGSRAIPEISRATPEVPSVPPGPISVDDDARSRPSFVLASTVQPDEAAGDRSALARSEPGAMAGRGDHARERRGPPTKVKILAPVVALAVITLAIGAGWKAREHTGEGPTASSGGATAKNAPSSANAAPTTTDSTTANGAGAPSALAPASATSPIASALTRLEDAGVLVTTPSSPAVPPRASAPVPVSTGPRGRPPASSGTPSTANVTTVASTKRAGAGSAPPRASAQPNHDDPLF
jgi:serine/threonine-protein kinase